MKLNLLFRPSMVIVLAMMFTLMLSCQNTLVPDELSVADEMKYAASTNIYSANGILAFKSMKAFDSFMQANRTPNIDTRKSLEKTYKYISLISFWNDASEKGLTTKQKYAEENNLFVLDNSDNLVLDFFSYPLASVLNQDGLIIIGAQLYRFSNYELRSVKLVNGPKLEQAVQMLTKSDLVLNKSVTTSKIYHTPVVNVEKGARRSAGVYENGQNMYAGNLNSDTGEGSSMQIYLYLTSWQWSNTQCEYYVYDPNCGCDSCSGETTTTNGYATFFGTSAYSYLFTTSFLSGTQYRRDNNAPYTSVFGSVVIYRDGSSYPVNYSLQFNGGFAGGDFWGSWYSPYYSSLEIEGNANFESRHSNGFLQNLSITL